MKQLIRLTENDVHNIVKQVITEVLSEMDKDTALYPTTIYAATDNMIDNGQLSSQSKNGQLINLNRVNIKARKIADRAIMHYVIQEMKPYLSFRMKDKTYPNRHVGLEFEVKEIKEFSESQMQLYGFITTANWKGYEKKHGVIKCVFGDNGKDGIPSKFKFYLVENYGNVVKTPSIELLAFSENENKVKEIISRIYELRQEAERNAVTITDLSNNNLNGNLNQKPKKTYKPKPTTK